MHHRYTLHSLMMACVEVTVVVTFVVSDAVPSTSVRAIQLDWKAQDNNARERFSAVWKSGEDSGGTA